MYQSFTDTTTEKNSRKPGTTVLLKNSKATDKTGGFTWIYNEKNLVHIVSMEF